MKQFGFTGKGTGRLGSSVFAISGGAQIVRQYNPIVANPNTASQVNQRSKFKLLSQLSASLAAAISIPREGLVSSRNRFTKLNIGSASVSDGTASIDVKALKITAGAQTLPEATQDTQDGTTYVGIDSGIPTNVSQVAFFCYKIANDGSLVPAGTKLEDVFESAQGVRNVVGMPIPSDHGTYVTYLYGLITEDAAAQAAYGDLNVASATQLASLVANRTIASIGANVTKSQAVQTTVA